MSLRFVKTEWLILQPLKCVYISASLMWMKSGCGFHKPSDCVLLRIKNMLASCLSCISVLGWRNVQW